MKCIIETLVFLGRQGVAFRGHRENDESMNKGNFLELLDLRAKDNPTISCFYHDRKKYTTYTSHNIQNTLLEIIANNIRIRFWLRSKLLR